MSKYFGYFLCILLGYRFKGIRESSISNIEKLSSDSKILLNLKLCWFISILFHLAVYIIWTKWVDWLDRTCCDDSCWGGKKELEKLVVIFITSFIEKNLLKLTLSFISNWFHLSIRFCWAVWRWEGGNGCFTPVLEVHYMDNRPLEHNHRLVISTLRTLVTNSSFHC